MKGRKVAGSGLAILALCATASASTLPPAPTTAARPKSAPAAPVSGSAEANALARINKVRAAAGLEPVELDATLSRGCAAHARYLDINRNHPKAQGLGMHREAPGLPGVTLEGRAAGMMSVIARRDSLSVAVDAFLATLYHRVPLLRPSLKRVGMGFCGRTAVINIHGGVEGLDEAPVGFPTANQANVPLEFPWELPDPIPPGASRPAGYPITLQFPMDGPEVSGVRAELTDSAGRGVKFHLSHPGKPACEFPQMNTICVIPATRLKPGASYKVKIAGQYDGTAFNREWSFTTASVSVASGGRGDRVAAARR